MSSKTVLHTLIDARKLIERPEDWKKGPDVCFDDTPTCASVAMEIASRRAEGTVSYDGWEAAATLFQKANGISDTCIPAWNDAPERTHLDVLAAFDAAIEYAKAEDAP